MINEKPVRKTKRIKQFNPKEALSTAEVQTLVSYMKDELQELEQKVTMRLHYAKVFKGVDDEYSKNYYKLADKFIQKRDKLAKIQRKLKKGLMQPYV